MKLLHMFLSILILKPFHFFQSLSLKKKLFTLIILGVAGYVLYQQFLAQPTKPTYTTAVAKKDTIVEVVTETGNITTNGRTDIYSPTNGVIEEVFVNNGQTVEAGEPLFTIQSSATEQEKSQALANYLAAKNSLDTANATLHTLQAQMFAANQTFMNGKGVSNPVKDDPNYVQENANWLAAEANYKKQQVVITQAQTALSSANLLYQATQNATVKATTQGIVSNLAVTIGSSVKANLPTSPVRPLATIATLAKTEAIVSLSENDIVKVAQGQKATIELNAIHDKRYEGIVQRVDTIGTEEQGVIRYNVYIELTNPDENIRPGMNVDARIITKTLTNVLAVPNSAVKPYQGKRAVRIPDKKTGEITYVPVVIGVKGDKKTEIQNGITEGQQVITSLSNDQLKRPGLFGN